MKEARVLAAIFGTEWAITPEALRSIVAIAQRHNESPEAVEARLGRPLENTQRAEMRGSVAVIPVTGPLFRRANSFTRVSGATSYAMVAQDLREALDNPSVTSIVLNIDSPGGTASGVAELSAHVYEARKEKPVIAYVGGMGASAAYWLAAASTKIVANKTALVGSVGVVVGVSKGNDDTEEIVSSQSPYKRIDPSTADGRARIQAMVDNMAAIFIADVAQYRAKSVDHVSANFGQGDVLLGQAAVDAGMIDSLGTFEGLIAELNAKPTIRPSHLYGAKSMNLEELKAQHPGLFAEIEALHAKDVEAVKAKAAEDQAKAVESAKVEGASAERTRVLGIIGHAEAKGREAMALKLADMPTMTVEAAVGLLSATPKVEAAKGSEFEAAMKAANPGIDPDAGERGEKDEAEATIARIHALGKRHGIL